jgi:hypothetical protein
MTQQFPTFLILLISFLLTDCAHRTRTPLQTEEPLENELVSLDAALQHLTQSYILGCSQAYKNLKQENFYPLCLDLGLKHRNEVKSLLLQPIETPQK